MTSPKTLLKAWGLQAKKQLGQNFLADPSTTRMIVDRAGVTGEDIVLEIGAGLGALTIPTAQVSERVLAVETDRRLIDLLKTELTVNNLQNVTVFKQDILRLDLPAFFAAQNVDRRAVVMANLPYYISSQVLVMLIQHRHLISRAYLMFQKELAERLMAEPGVKDYGRLTVMLRYCADIRPLAKVQAHLFYPKPKVDSEVVEVVFKEKPEYPAEDEAFLFKVIKAAFGQRRKTLKNALAGSELRLSPQIAKDALETAGIEISRRAETLTVQEFVELSRCLSLQQGVWK